MPSYGASGAAPLASMSVEELIAAVELEWQERALCAQTDPEAFFPSRKKAVLHVRQNASAKAVKFVTSVWNTLLNTMNALESGVVCRSVNGVA